MVLQAVKVSHLSIIQSRFYESPYLKNWMCELCMFSQIHSHNIILSMTAHLFDKRVRVSNACNTDFRLFMVLGEEMLKHCIYLALYLGHA